MYKVMKLSTDKNNITLTIKWRNMAYYLAMGMYWIVVLVIGVIAFYIAIALTFHLQDVVWYDILGNVQEVW